MRFIQFLFCFYLCRFTLCCGRSNTDRVCVLVCVLSAVQPTKNQLTGIHLFIVGFRAEHQENRFVGPKRQTCGPNATPKADASKEGAVECTFTFYYYLFILNMFVYAYCASHTHSRTHAPPNPELFSRILVFVSIRPLYIGGWCSLHLSLNKTLIYAFTCKFMRHSQTHAISSLSVSLIRMCVSCVWPMWLANA